MSVSTLPTPDNAEMISDDDWDDSDDEPLLPILSQIGHPELQTLSFPSAFPFASLEGEKCGSLIQIEVDLREAWANELLHNLRLEVGNKSLNFTKGIRKAGVKRHATRSWDNIRAIQHQAGHLRRVYNANRQVMQQIGRSDTTIRYKEVTDTDLNASSLLAAPNTSGQSKKTLSWIWTINEVQMPTSQDDVLLTEC